MKFCKPTWPWLQYKNLFPSTHFCTLNRKVKENTSTKVLCKPKYTFFRVRQSLMMMMIMMILLMMKLIMIIIILPKFITDKCLLLQFNHTFIPEPMSISFQGQHLFPPICQQQSVSPTPTFLAVLYQTRDENTWPDMSPSLHYI